MHPNFNLIKNGIAPLLKLLIYNQFDLFLEFLNDIKINPHFIRLEI